MPNHVTNILTFSGNEETLKKMISEIAFSEKKYTFDFNSVVPIPENVYKGDFSLEEKELFGKLNWYDWCTENWRTKWNSYDYEDEAEREKRWEEKKELKFLTAWSAPHPTIVALSNKYPNIQIDHKWADEDMGYNCGRMIYKDGIIIERKKFEFGKREAQEFAANILGYDLEAEYKLNSNGTKWEWVEE